MTVFILEGWIPYEQSMVMGVYNTRLEAIHAAMVHKDADKAARLEYYINELVVGAPAQDRLLYGEAIKMGK